MNSIDFKKDAILRCLNFYYSKFNYSNENYRHTGDESDRTSEFISISSISAWLDFGEKKMIIINRSELEGLLIQLEVDKLITVKRIEGEQSYKIEPNGISLLESKGHVRRTEREEVDYWLKWASVILSLIAIIISIVALNKK